MSDWLLQARGIQKTFKKGKLKIHVLKGVDFHVAPRETVAIVGASGAGKSTFLHILGTLEAPTSGKIFFRGEDIFAGSDDERSLFRNRNLGFVFQSHYLLPEFTALENVMMPGLIAGRSESAMAERAKTLLHDVGLSHRWHHKPSELSGGESQRVAVARALQMNPGLILADELTGNLDSENSDHLMHILLDLNKKHGVSLVVVTHDKVVARRMSRVVEMRDGMIAE